MLPKEGSPGGRVSGLEGLTPIRVEQVSPFSLARYLLSQRPDLNLNPKKAQYKVIFQRLRELPQPNQESLLVGFFENGVKSFPNGGALGRKLAQINNIPWFEPKEKPDPTILQGHVNEHLFRLGLKTLPLRIIDNWDTARNMARGAVWDTPRNTSWDTARNMARGAVWDTPRNAVWNTVAWGAIDEAAWVVADDAAWITVKDIMPKSNPFSPLTRIYNLGCCPIGVVPNEKGKQEFAIFIPQYQKPHF